jgi:hypothetical protein
MKTKFYLVMATLMASMVNVMADGDSIITHLYESTGQELSVVKGERDFYISKDNSYITGLQVGNRIEISGSDVEGDCHAYIGDYDPDVHFPGSDYRATSSLPISFYLTEDFIASIKAHDFRLHGNGAKINYITLYRGKYNVSGAIKFGKTIWTGYFWIDTPEGKTLEVYKEALDVVNLDDYYSIRFYHEANRSISINILDTWEGAKIADQATMNMTNEYAELILTDEIKTKLRNLTLDLKIQCFTEDDTEEKKFNFTDVVLIPKRLEGCDNCFYYTY